jgi:hypothetical protein
MSTPLQNTEKYFLATKDEIKLLPFPKLITSYFTDKNVPLKLV